MKNLPRWTVTYNNVSPESYRWGGRGWEFFDEEKDAQTCYDRQVRVGNCPTKRPFYQRTDFEHLGAAHQWERKEA